MIKKHLALVDKAGKDGVQILCLQEIFSTPYFCPSQDAKWYATAEPVPGPSTELLSKHAKKYRMAVVPALRGPHARVYTTPPRS